MKLHIATYNIHKGFSHFNRRMMVHELRDHLRLLDADIVFLQEVQGEHEHHADALRGLAGRSRSTSFSPTRCGRTTPTAAMPSTTTAITATPSSAAIPIRSARRTRTSPPTASNSRGLLHCEIELPGRPQPALPVRAPRLHERGRRHQVAALIERVQRVVPDGRAAGRRRRFQRLAQPRRAPAGRGARPARGAPRPARAAGAQLSEHLPAAAPGPHLRARLRRAARRSAPWPPWSRISDHAALSAHLQLE